VHAQTGKKWIKLAYVQYPCNYNCKGKGNEELTYAGGEVEDSGLLWIPRFLLPPLILLVFQLSWVACSLMYFSLCVCVCSSSFGPLCCSSCFVIWFPLFIRWFSQFSSIFPPLLVCWFSRFSSVFLLSPLFWSSIVVLLWRAQVLVQLLLKMETWHAQSAGPKEGSLLL